MDELDVVVRVGGKSRPADVAGALAGIYREHGQAAAQAIGAGAVNQMIKAMAVACSYLLEDGLRMACVPSFQDVGENGQELTAMRLALVERSG